MADKVAILTAVIMCKGMHARLGCHLMQEDQLIHAAVNASLMQAPPIQIVPVTSATRSLDIWREWCPAESHNASLLLLLPAEYQLLRAADQALPDMARLMAYTAARNSSIGAMTFGARLPNGKVRGMLAGMATLQRLPFSEQQKFLWGSANDQLYASIRCTCWPSIAPPDLILFTRADAF